MISTCFSDNYCKSVIYYIIVYVCCKYFCTTDLGHLKSSHFPQKVQLIMKNHIMLCSHCQASLSCTATQRDPRVQGSLFISSSWIFLRYFSWTMQADLHLRLSQRICMLGHCEIISHFIIGKQQSEWTWNLKEQCHISRIFYFFIFLLFYEFLVDSVRLKHINCIIFTFFCMQEQQMCGEITAIATVTSRLDFCILHALNTLHTK